MVTLIVWVNMLRTKYYKGILLLTLVFQFLISSSNRSINLTANADTKKLQKIDIGVLTELSGPFAINGEDCKAGQQLAYNLMTKQGEIGNYKINPIITPQIIYKILKII